MRSPFDIVLPMHDANDPKQVRISIDDEIRVHGPEKHLACGQVVAFVSNAVRLSKLAEGMQVFKYAIRGVEALLGNVFPDVLKIPDRALGEFELVLARCRRRSAL